MCQIRCLDAGLSRIQTSNRCTSQSIAFFLPYDRKASSSSPHLHLESTVLAVGRNNSPNCGIGGQESVPRVGYIIGTADSPFGEDWCTQHLCAALQYCPFGVIRPQRTTTTPPTVETRLERQVHRHRHCPRSRRPRPSDNSWQPLLDPSYNHERFARSL